jgi:2-methylcitrate dehydratase PrpD
LSRAVSNLICLSKGDRFACKTDPITPIVDHLCASRFEHLDEATINAAKKAVLDTFGAGLAGSSAPMGKMVSRMAVDQGGKATSTLWVTGNRIPMLEAAFANAIMGRCRELDDVHESSPRASMGHGGHVNVMIVPGALAVLEGLPNPVSGRDLISAIAAGGDLIPRLRMAAGGSGSIGWEGPTLGPFGVAAAVGKLWKFNSGKMANAMGAAYAHCAGNILSTSDGTWDVWLNAGVATRAGVLAAELARHGHQGVHAPLLGSAGLYPLYFRGEYHEEALLSALGEHFESANVSIKPYASCKGTHHAIQTALELKEQHMIQANEIARIVVRTCQYKMQMVVNDSARVVKPAPTSTNEAQFSMAFTIAMALVKGSVFADIFSDDALQGPEILRLFARTDISATPDKDALQKTEGYPPDDVEIHMKNGAIHTGCAQLVTGHPKRPMNFNEVAAKFWRCAAMSERTFPDDALEKFISTVRRLEDVADVRSLIGQLHTALR